MGGEDGADFVEFLDSEWVERVVRGVGVVVAFLTGLVARGVLEDFGFGLEAVFGGGGAPG